MTDKHLIVKGGAGLGNRLITLSNAIEYAKKTSRILLVDWSDGQFGVKGKNVFYDYFCLNQINHTESIDSIFTGKTKLKCYPPVWGESPFDSLYDLYVYYNSNYLQHIIPANVKGSISKLRGCWRQKDIPDNKNCRDWQALISVFKRNDITLGSMYRRKMNYDVVFFVDFCPKFYTETFRKHITIKEYLVKEIDEIANKLGLEKNTIGVHVRMTDKEPETSLDFLFRKIENLKINNKKIFLSTDNEEVEEQFKHQFQNVIYTQKWRPEGTGIQMGMHQYAIRSKDYSSAENLLKESIIDMWLLSKCEYLIYQKNSSFSKISSIIKNQPEKTYTW